MLFYADRIPDKENIRKREPEGYLICVNVPIARTGTQQYLKDEIGQQGNDLVTLYRPEEEVFSKETMGSFEGMPVTDDHPHEEEGVTAENIRWYQKGHCQNVRRGTGKESNMLIADLVITDPDLVQKVLDGKREISCGYHYELSEEDGKYVQRQIRGNHVAIVDEGRAGHRVCIKDSATNLERGKRKMAKTKHGVWAKMLAKYVKDAEPEEVAEAIEAIDDITSDPQEENQLKDDSETVSAKLDNIAGLIQNIPAKSEAEAKDGDENVVEKKVVEEVKTDGEPDKLDTVIDLLKQLLAKNGADCGANCKDGEPEETDPLKKLEDDLEELEKKDEEATDGDPEDEETEEGYAPDEDPTEPEAHFVDPEEINEKDEEVPAEFEEEKEKTGGMDRRARDAMRAAIKAMKPLIAKLPEKERRAAADAAAASIRKSYGMSAKPVRNDYSKIQKRRKAMDHAAVQEKAEKALAQRIMEKRNVNYKK